jgi:hypothetical protein
LYFQAIAKTRFLGYRLGMTFRHGLPGEGIGVIGQPLTGDLKIFSDEDRRRVWSMRHDSIGKTERQKEAGLEGQ